MWQQAETSPKMTRSFVLAHLFSLHLPFCTGLFDPVNHIESARLYGNIDAYAYYFVHLLVGTPPQRVSVILDTGSGITAFPCRKCNHCGRHMDPNFDIDSSTSASWIQCGSSCRGTCKSTHCGYHQGYTEGSSISGWYFSDIVRLGDAIQRNPTVTVRLGCHQDENRLFYTQKANGIMGIRPPGYGNPTILDAFLGDTAHMIRNIFSICLSEWGGRLVLGGYNRSYHTGFVQYIPLTAQRHYYNVPLTKMVLDGQTLSTRYGSAMIDSGTTYTYMASEAYRALRGAIENYCTHHDCGASRSGHCYNVQNDLSAFPKVEVWFENVKTIWVPQAYMYQKSGGNRYCYAFEDDGAHANTVLGASWMMMQEVIFDLKNQVVGVVQANCPRYKNRPTWDANADLTVPVAPTPQGQTWAAPAQVPDPKSQANAFLTPPSTQTVQQPAESVEAAKNPQTIDIPAPLDQNKMWVPPPSAGPGGGSITTAAVMSIATLATLVLFVLAGKLWFRPSVLKDVVKASTTPPSSNAQKVVGRQHIHIDEEEPDIKENNPLVAATRVKK